MKNVLHLAVLYGLFAAIATMVNIGCQALVIGFYQDAHAVPISILMGTAAALPVKYLLEKRHIFNFKSKNRAHDGRLFMLYSVMGVFTTALFWGIEYLFQHVFGTDTMRYAGGVIGLALGYVIKYHLDKHFVFVDRTAAASGAT